MNRYTLIFVFLSFLYWQPLYSKEKVVTPLIWKLDKLREIRSNQKYNKLYNHIILMADSLCEEKVIVLTESRKQFVNSSHYYCSISPYWWPDTSEGQVTYIWKDGIINPDYYKSDSQLLKELEKRCKYLSVAFYLTKNDKYFESYVKQIKAWFIDKETYMYPNFEYTQVVPGENENRGRHTGIIEAYAFNSVLESLRLITVGRQLEYRTENGLRRWFKKFANWMQSSDLGKKQSISAGNLSIAYDVTLINLYLYANDYKAAYRIADSFYDKRILSQIESDGSQPNELKRTKAFLYSIYNLTHIIDYLLITDRIGYAKNRTMSLNRIGLAFEYLMQFADDGSSFPYNEIYKSNWDVCSKEFKKQESRYRGLSHKESNDIMIEKTLSETFNNIFD